MIARQFAGMQGVDGVAVVIDLADQAGKGLLHGDQLFPYIRRQERCFQVLLPGKVIKGGSVEKDGRPVHGQCGGNGGKAGQGPACGHGEDAALGHEIVDGLPVCAVKRRQIAAA